MKIKTISRLEENYTRKAKKDIFRICRNYAPEVHPFEKVFTAYSLILTSTNFYFILREGNTYEL
jgi:hypothetical protein